MWELLDRREELYNCVLGTGSDVYTVLYNYRPRAMYSSTGIEYEEGTAVAVNDFRKSKKKRKLTKERMYLKIDPNLNPTTNFRFHWCV